jgi:hypothetical protein
MFAVHPTQPKPVGTANDGCGATLATSRNLEHRQLGADSRRSLDDEGAAGFDPGCVKTPRMI